MMVSVVIPTYNRSGFLKTAIDSVLAQSFKDYELVIIDDGSIDETIDLLESYGNSLRYVRQENRGPASARNRGIEESRGKLVAFLDSDDQWHPDKLLYQTAAMEREPVYLISHTEEIWYRNGNILHQKKKHRKIQGDIFQKSLLICMVSMSTVMVRRKLFNEIGYFDELMPCCEDYDFWLRAAVNHEFLLIDKELTFKDGGRDDQVSHIHRIGMDRFRIRSIIKVIENYRLLPEQKELALRELKRKCRIYGNGCIKWGKVEEGRRYLQLAEKYLYSR